METNVMRIFTAAAVAFAAAVLQAETYTWSGGVDTYWLTPGNWSISGSATESIPGNPDTAVFSGADDTTVVLTNTTSETVYIQSVRVEEGAGAVTIRIPDGWFNARKLQFRRIGGGSERPSVTNIVNNSSHPLTFHYEDSSKLSVHFDNYSGDWAAMPGVIYEGPVTMASGAKAWLLPQTDLRTDNDEMNKSVFKNAVTFSANGLAIGANHEVDIPSTGTMTIPSDDFTVKGTLVVDGGKLVCNKISCSGDGEVIMKNGAALEIGSLADTVITINPSFALSSSGALEVGDILKIKKDGLDAAPTQENFKIGEISGITAGANHLFEVSIDSESDADYYLVSVSPATFAVMKGSNAYNTDWTAGDLWNGADAVAAGTHYLLRGSSHRLNSELGDSETSFKGESLVITGDSSGTCWLGLKNMTNTVDCLVLGAHGLLSFNETQNTRKEGQWFKGNIYIGSDTDGKAAYVKSSHGKPCRIEAKINGEGELRFEPSSNYDFDLSLSGDNSGYLGKIIFGRTATHKVSVTIAAADALGGNPASELEDGVRLDNTVMKVTDDVELLASNRRWKIMRVSSVDVAEGKSFTIPSDIEYVAGGSDAPSLEKSGAGVLVLAGAVKSAAANTAFSVSAGTLAVKNSHALEGIASVTFDEGTTLKLPVTASNGENGFLLVNNAITSLSAIEFDVGEYTEPPVKVVPLFSMVKGEGVTLTADAVKAAIKRPFKGYQVAVTAEDVEVEGVTYMRFSARFSRSFVVILR